MGSSRTEYLDILGYCKMAPTYFRQIHVVKPRYIMGGSTRQNRVVVQQNLIVKSMRPTSCHFGIHVQNYICMIHGINYPLAVWRGTWPACRRFFPQRKRVSSPMLGSREKYRKLKHPSFTAMCPLNALRVATFLPPLRLDSSDLFPFGLHLLCITLGRWRTFI